MGHAQTKYLNPNQLDVYQDIYDVVEKLNGDYEPFPTEIETKQFIKSKEILNYILGMISLF